MIKFRIQSKVSQAELEDKVGKILMPTDYNAMLTGPCFVSQPNGKPLCVYLPGAMKHVTTEETYKIFHGLKTSKTDNRGNASGTLRVVDGAGKRSRSLPVASSIIGSMDPVSVYKYCRLTAWTGDHLPEWRKLQPYLQEVAKNFKQQVPDRYEAQMREVKATKPEWIVPGTPFTTVTVNNTYPTGVHQDAGDLDSGFSTIACIRRGNYSGGHLTFPEFRVSVDMKDGDLLLMDAHQWHGNTAIVCECGNRLNGRCPLCGAERISIVSYYRTKMRQCGTTQDELEKAAEKREKRNQVA